MLSCLCFKMQTDNLQAYHLVTNDTTYVTYTITHDSIETAHIPEKYIHRGDTIITIFDTSYYTYSDNQRYASVDGSVNVTVPLYDTVDAYDSIFICHGCAVHDTVRIVITPDSSNIEYGAFILNSPQTSLPSRITQCQAISTKCEWFRYNYNRGDLFYSVNQIQTAGLKVAMTYNWRKVTDVAPFPTGADLTRDTTTADSLYQITKPDLTSIENEEGNSAYHKGTVTDYLAELHANAIVAHRYHIPISNGGTTNGAIFSFRQDYYDRGKADSAHWIDTTLGLNPNTSASYSLQQVAWNKTLLLNIKAAGADYVNFHWYEWPIAADISITHTSGILPELIKYMQRVSGLPVITTEAGCRNSSTALLIEMFTEIKNSPTRIAIYYDGGGPLAVQNELGYKTFLNSYSFDNYFYNQTWAYNKRSLKKPKR